MFETKDLDWHSFDIVERNAKARERFFGQGASYQIPVTKFRAMVRDKLIIDIRMIVHKKINELDYIIESEYKYLDELLAYFLEKVGIIVIKDKNNELNEIEQASESVLKKKLPFKVL
jgi:hypothetical protein